MKADLTFQFMRSAKGHWFRIVAKNGRILASSETYKTRRAMIRAVKIIQLNAHAADFR